MGWGIMSRSRLGAAVVVLALLVPAAAGTDAVVASPFSGRGAALASDGQPVSSFPGAVTSSPDDVLATVQLPDGMDVGAIALDSTHRRAYVSDRLGTSGIVVIDFDGHRHAGIPATHPGGMAVAPDGSRLFVAEIGSDRIRVFDLTSEPPAELTPIPVSTAAPLVGDIAIAGGRLWFGYGHCGQWDSGIASASLDPAAPDVATYDQPGLRELYCALVFATAPLRPGLLVGWEVGITPASVYSFDVSADPPRLLGTAERILPRAAYALGVDAAGTAIAAPTQDGVTRLDPDTMQPIGSECDTPGLETSALMSPDGDVALAGDFRSTVSVSTVTAGCVLRNGFVLGDSRKGAGIDPGSAQMTYGITLSSDGSRLFAVTRDTGGQSVEILDDPLGTSTTMTVASDPWSPVPGQTATVSGTVAFGDSAPSADREVDVSEIRPDSTTAALGTARTDGDGRWQVVTGRLDQPGFVTFVASFAGDDEHRRGSADVTVQVRGSRRLGRDATTTVGVDAAHTGNLPAGSLQPPLVPAWAVRFPGGVSGSLVTPRAIVLTTQAESVLALDPLTGLVLWGPVKVGSSLMPAYEWGRVFTAGYDGVMAALDAETGAVMWRRKVGEELGAPVASQGVVSAKFSGGVVALDEESGRVLWTRIFDSGGTQTPIAVPGRILVNDYEWQVRAFDLRGRLTAHYGGGLGTSALSAAYRNRLYLRSAGWGAPGGIRDDTGEVVGQFLSSAPAAFHDGLGLFIQGSLCPSFEYESECWVRGQDLATGEAAWEFHGDRKVATEPIVVGDVVYVGSGSGWLYGFEVSTGRVVTAVNIGVPIGAYGSEAAGPTAGDGLLVVPLGQAVVAFRSAGPTLSADTAMVRFGRESRRAPAAFRTVTFSDSGASPLRVGLVRVAGPDAAEYRITSDACTGTTLPTGASCAVVVAFHPATTGPRRALLELVDTGAGAQQTLEMRGFGT
jgi:outer membrane protein assembly factor BamB